MEYFAYSQKAFVYKYVVMLSDNDQFEHMSFANYLRLMFLATDALFVGFFTPAFLSQYRLNLLTSRMQFKRQTTVGDNLLVKVNTSSLGNTSFTLLYTYVIEGTGDLVALGRQSYDLEGLSEEVHLGEQIRNGLKNILGPILVDEKHLLYKY